MRPEERGDGMTELQLPAGVTVTGPVSEAGARILGPEASAFVADLVREFRAFSGETPSAFMKMRSADGQTIVYD